MSGREANQPIRPPLPLGKSPLLLRDGVLETNERGQVIGEAIRQCKDNVHENGAAVEALYQAASSLISDVVTRDSAVTALAAAVRRVEGK